MKQGKTPRESICPITDKPHRWHEHPLGEFCLDCRRPRESVKEEGE